MINWGELYGRIDPNYYKKEYRDLENIVLGQSKYKLRDFVLYMAGGATPKTTESDKYYSAKENGIPFLRVQNLSPEGLQIEDCKYINKETHENMLVRSKVSENNLLVKITGVGRMAISSVVPQEFEGNINQHMVVIKTKSKEISELLAAYLNSDIGEKLASRRSTGGTRPALDYSALRSIPIILNKEIIEIMDKAYSEKAEKEAEAKVLLESINDYLLSELGIEMPEEEENTLDNRKFYVSSNDVISGRFDPFYYKPIFTKTIDSIKNCKLDTKTLANCIIGNLVKGKLPNDSEKNGDKKVVQITNVNYDGTIDINNNLTAKPIFFKNQKLNKGDVLIVITGATIGKVGFWNYNGEYYLGGDLVKFNTGDYDLNIVYASLLRTAPYQLLFKRYTTGATNGHLSPNDIYKLYLPIISNAVKNKLSTYIINAQLKATKLQEEAKQAVSDAKIKVEKILLEGSL